MTDLTDKWKKGELPEGWYWVEYSIDEINGVAMMQYVPEFGGFSFTIIKQVLAPVPSYDEWKALNGNMDSVTYLGKSKANVNDLFEIKENNNAPIEN